MRLRLTTRLTTPTALLAVVALCLSLTGCGSQLSPEEVRRAQGIAGGGDGTGTGDGSTDGGPQPGGGSTGDGPGGGSGPGSGGSKVKAGSCAGFKNTTGISKSTIKIANASDISGPVPGLMESAQQGVKAYVAYFNSGQSICGRKLELMNLDSRTDTAGDQQSAIKACQEAFAMVGSLSAFDHGGAKAVSDCGIPDVRAATVNATRQNAPTVYAANSVQVDEIPVVVPDYLKSKHPSAAKNAAFLYLNAGAAAANAKSWIAGWGKRGFRFTYTEGIETSEFNYSPYVTQMKNKGVKYVQFLGSYQHAVRLAKAMQQQSFKPDVFLLDPTGYNSNFVKSGGSAVDGVRVFTNSVLFEDPQTAEMRLYRGWLERVAPGATPSYFGLFAWSAARLFTEQALKLGGKLTRQSLLAAIRTVRAWTGHGLFAPQDVGGRHTAGCNSIIQLRNGKWVHESKRYLCGSVLNTGVSG
ncbi:MAG: ABC transporter substrate-binding protein [Micromonosporaceae bacterium]